MSVLLIKTNGMPEDEAAEIRTLLDEAGLAFYETDEGRWGISVGGFWLKDKDDLAEARALLEKYDQERGERVRAEYRRLQLDGRAETLWDRLRNEPLRLIAYLLAIAAVLYLMLMPFYGFHR